MADDFSDSPTTIGEIKVARSQDVKDWTPRDALIALLRDIDAGRVEVTNVVIASAVKSEDGGEDLIDIRASAQSTFHAIGLLEAAKPIMFE